MFDQDARHGSSVKTGADFALEYLDLNKVFRPFVGRLPESGAVDGAAGIIGSIPAREPAFPVCFQEGPHLFKHRGRFGVALMTSRLEPVGKALLGGAFSFFRFPAGQPESGGQFPGSGNNSEPLRHATDLPILDTCTQFDGEGVPTFELGGIVTGKQIGRAHV